MTATEGASPRSGALLGVYGVQGLEGGGEVGSVDISLNPPVGLLNGGTGVRAASNTALLDGIGALPRAGGSMTGNLAVVGGVVIGNPPDGNLGPGTLNTSDLIEINASSATVRSSYANTLLHAESDGLGARIVLTGYGGNANFTVRSGRPGGTGASPLVLQPGDFFGAVTFTGYTGLSGPGADPQGWPTVPQRRAGMTARSLDDWSVSHGCELYWDTTTTGTVQLVERMRLSQGLIVGDPLGAGVNGTNDMGHGAINCERLCVNGTDISGSAGLPITGGTVTGLVTIDGGANNPPLTVKADAGVAAEIRFDNATAGAWAIGPGGAGVFRIADYSGVVPGAPARITINGSTGEVGIVHNLEVEGNLNVVGDIVGGTVTPSDRRIKQNIAPWECGLAAVRRLQPIRFEYNGLGGMSADGRLRIGLDADDTGAVIPEMVGPLKSPSLDGTSVKAVRPETLVYALVNCIKELDARLQGLEGGRR